MKIKQLFLSLALTVSAVSCKEETPVSKADLQAGTGKNSFQTMGASKFVHPGVYNSQEELDFIKQKVNAGSQPWKDGYDKMMEHPGSRLSFTTTAHSIIYAGGQESGAPAGATTDKFSDAAHAAYSHALQWVITGNQANADKSIEILDEWGGTLTEIRSATGAYRYQNTLHAAQYSSVFVAAAEIIKYTNAGWSNAGVTDFQNMLKNAIYPRVIYMAPCNNGYTTPGCSYTDNPEFTTLTTRASNQEASMAQSKMAIGVFTGDQAIFDLGKDQWLWLIKRFVYPSGQSGEACRDCTHSEMGLMGLIGGAEIAWQQGIDLYAESNSRLSVGMEWYAKALLGISQTKTCDGTNSNMNCSNTGKVPGWEIGLNHYYNRAGKPMPSSVDVVQGIMRPEGHRWNFLSWNTLTHAKLPKSFNKALNKPVTFSIQQTGNEASDAVDGDLNTRWSARYYPQWIQVDLGATTRIKKTELAPTSNRAYKYKIEVKTSSTGAYTTVVDKTSNTTGGALQTDTFDPVNARYVKVTITGCSGSECSSLNWASINEFRVF